MWHHIREGFLSFVFSLAGTGAGPHSESTCVKWGQEKPQMNSLGVSSDSHSHRPLFESVASRIKSMIQSPFPGTQIVSSFPLLALPWQWTLQVLNHYEPNQTVLPVGVQSADSWEKPLMSHVRKKKSPVLFRFSRCSFCSFPSPNHLFPEWLSWKTS